MHYLAVLGREKELSLAELESVGTSVSPFGDCALLGTEPDLKSLGGSLKTATIIDQPKWQGWDKLKIDLDKLPTTEGKVVFGVSYYGPKQFTSGLKSWALELKKQLRPRGSVRAVVAEPALSAAQLKFNQILGKGFELIVAVQEDRTVLALTQQFQDIDWYSKRDYDRPKRSAKIGMLPPKLAQMMINLTQGEKIYDPFCGTGVVLQEALLMGKPTAGSDLEAQMIEYTEANLQWLRGQVDHKLPEATIKLSDAREIKLPAGYSIVSEGYLGPALVKPPSPSELAQLKAELNAFYAECLTNWLSELGPDQRISLAVPCWQIDGRFETLPLIDQIDEIGYNLVRFQTVDSRRLIYARPDQIVGRQVLVLQPKLKAQSFRL